MSVEQQIHIAAAEAVAPGSRIHGAQPYRRHPSPFPVKLELSTADGLMECVVKTAPTHASRLSVEATALAVMEQIGADAPRLLAGPTLTSTDDGPIEFLVMTVLPGKSLPWLSVNDVATADRTCRLLFRAIETLHGLTDRLIALPAGDTIARRTLDQELADLLARTTPWVETSLFDRAVDLLNRHVADHRLPLVFSNGDYNPLNVLTDDDGMTGWVDFEHAAIEDPLIGLPKFQFWADDSGWMLASQTGLVERYLYRHRVSPDAFAIRVLLRGLTHLHDSAPDKPPTVMIDTMENAIATLQRKP